MPFLLAEGLDSSALIGAFGIIVTIIGAASVVIFKMGSKDEQFRAMLENVSELAKKQASHNIELAQLKDIVTSLLQMQKVDGSDRERLRTDVNRAFDRIAVLEARKHKSMTDT